MRKSTVAFVVLALGANELLAQINTGAPLPAAVAPPSAQAPQVFDSAELERIMSPIALYPDPLLAQVLTATTFSGDIPSAMRWVEARRGFTGEQLTNALADERVTWNPSVQALVAFPTVLQMMASSMSWTDEVGQAFTMQRGDVMDAVQRLRAQAQRYGYLRSTSDLQVVQSPEIEIRPVNPSYVVVPYYNPVVVFAPPRPRFLVSSAIYLGFGVRLGGWYEPFGFRSHRVYWPTHRVVVDYSGWSRYGRRDDYRDVRYTSPHFTTPRYTPPRGVVVRGRGYAERPAPPRYDGGQRSDRDRDRDRYQPRAQQHDEPRVARNAQPDQRSARPQSPSSAQSSGAVRVAHSRRDGGRPRD